MKTVCKKLFSLMLVAVLLVSAIPFQASANEGYQVVMYVNGSQVATKTYTGNATEWTSNIAEALDYPFSEYHVEGYQFAGQDRVAKNEKVTLTTDDVLHINVEKHTKTTTKVDATCTEAGVETTTCTVCLAKVSETSIPATGHSYGTGSVTTAPGCEANGVRTFTCSVCNAVETREEAATGHNYTSSVTTAATCTAKGVRTYTCSGCDDSYTEDIEMIPHSYVNNVCTACGDIGTHIATVTFNYLDAEGKNTYAVRYVTADGQTITPPSVPANPVAGFSYWAENENGTGMTLRKDEGLAYNSQSPNTFYAIYNEPSAQSELRIYAVRYVDDIRKEAHYLFSDYFTTSNTTNNMYQYLWDNSDEIFTAAVNKVGAGYTWNNKFYDLFTDEDLTTANMKDNGPKSVYIKMNTKDSNEAQVLLYIHKGKTSTVSDILEMTGYTAGEKVYLNNSVRNFLKDKGYKWTAINMYTNEDWKRLMNGESPSGTNVVDITDNSTYVIHVMLTNASVSNNADSSNPKTGDYITAAVATMALAGAAFVALVEMKKRKMI